MTTSDSTAASRLPVHTGRVDVDLTAITDNVAALRARLAPEVALLSVVKADAYGHGLVPVARAAKAGGASWLGAAQLPEALALREAGLGGRIFTWLLTPGTDLRAPISADIDLAASSLEVLADIAAAARANRTTARVHLKIDTGLARSGATPAEWDELVAAAVALRDEGVIEATGIWSHLVAADELGHPSIQAQKLIFDYAIERAAELGWQPQVRHIANSAATLTLPELHYDLVRPGLAGYGLTPLPQLGGPGVFELRPAMALRTRLALVKPVGEGQGISYGHTYVTPSATILGLVPLGYADGIPRHASSRAEVFVGGRRARIVGRICMDQFVVDLGPDATDVAGDEVVLFGPGEVSAQDWAEAAETISYEIVTRISSRVPRHYLGEEQGAEQEVPS